MPTGGRLEADGRFCTVGSDRITGEEGLAVSLVEPEQPNFVLALPVESDLQNFGGEADSVDMPAAWLEGQNEKKEDKNKGDTG